MQKGSKLVTVLIGAVFFMPFLWLSIICAQCYAPNRTLFQWVNATLEALENPWKLRYTPYTIWAVVIAMAVYGFCISWYLNDTQNRRVGEEYGSAKWGDVKNTNRRFRTKKTDSYIRITKNLQISMNGRALKEEQWVNHNVIVLGGSGAGKTRGFILPNLMDANCSYVVTDPKGEIHKAVAGFLEGEGYEVSIFNLIDMANSAHYNPIAYCRTQEDVTKLVTNLILNTTPIDSRSNDPLWAKSEQLLMSAVIHFLQTEAPREEQNFRMMMEMLSESASGGDDVTPLDMLFDELEHANPKHIAVREYKDFKKAADKTASSILICLAARLATLHLEKIATLTDCDDLHIATLGSRKRVIFAVISDNDTTFNFLMGILYTQIFQELTYVADNHHGGRLPVPVRMMMDELANIALPKDFATVLSTCRSREISMNIVIQNLSQLKALFKDSWEGIIGNCNTFIYLGGEEPSTLEYVSKTLGKATINTRTYTRGHGKGGSYSVNYQSTGRELLLPDEVKRISNRKAIVFLKSKLPIMDFKYPIKEHPNYKKTTLGGMPPYVQSSARYEKQDLSYEPNLDDIEILEDEYNEPDNK